ncbi:MAG: hypothetical protein CHACPFDD_00818 [Phycisphaerae bacterium]|nr:hypothetical protein [Phycisphaerae bacterium]
MSIDSGFRRDLAARANALEPRAIVTADHLTENVIETVRSCFAHHDLVKVRIHAEDRDACDAAAGEIARRVPCEFVQRVGRIVTLYRPLPAPAAEAGASDAPPDAAADGEALPGDSGDPSARRASGPANERRAGRSPNERRTRRVVPRDDHGAQRVRVPRARRERRG